jgi:hypothetical protein
VEILSCAFGVLVDYGMIESPCGTPPLEKGVVVVVVLFGLLFGLWLNFLVVPPALRGGVWLFGLLLSLLFRAE